MKPYKFGLKAVQKIRRREEERALESYAQALRDRDQAVAQVRVAEQALAAEQSDWQRSPGAGCLAGALAVRSAGCQLLARRLEGCLRALVESERVLDQRWQDMLRTRQRSEALTQLDVQARHAHKIATDKEQQKFLDELAQRCGSTRAAWRLPQTAVVLL
jgi:flagellar export protein FliJ